MSEVKRRQAYVCPVCDRIVPRGGDTCTLPGHRRARPRLHTMVTAKDYDILARELAQANALAEGAGEQVDYLQDDVTNAVARGDAFARRLTEEVGYE